MICNHLSAETAVVGSYGAAAIGVVNSHSVDSTHLWVVHGGRCAGGEDGSVEKSAVIDQIALVRRHRWHHGRDVTARDVGSSSRRTVQVPVGSDAADWLLFQHAAEQWRFCSRLRRYTALRVQYYTDTTSNTCSRPTSASYSITTDRNWYINQQKTVLLCSSVNA